MTTIIALALCYGTLAPPRLLVGGDVSEIPQVEAGGGRYFYRGKPSDPFAAMKKLGWNFIRLREWNDPKEGWCDKAHTLAMAQRAQRAGFKISIDFHYSDWWADPGKQNKPAAWKNLGFDDLARAVRDYTRDVVDALVRQGSPPYMVQIGNEITPGMLWPDGRVAGNDPEEWGRLANLLRAGIDGVRDGQGKNRVLTMMHLDRGADNPGCRWWFDNLRKTGVDFDAIGLSYYPFWHGPIAAMEANVNDLAARYGKDVYIVELGYPWCWDPAPGPHVYNGPKVEDGYPATKDGQAAFTKRIVDIVRRIPGGKGKGVLWWAPLWISSPKEHSAYMNLALFDDSGAPLPAAEALGGKR